MSTCRPFALPRLVGIAELRRVLVTTRDYRMEPQVVGQHFRTARCRAQPLRVVAAAEPTFAVLLK